MHVRDSFTKPLSDTFGRVDPVSHLSQATQDPKHRSASSGLRRSSALSADRQARSRVGNGAAVVALIEAITPGYRAAVLLAAWCGLRRGG